MSRINVANFRHPDGTDDNITLDSSGRVGIGTTSPDDKLDIEGTGDVKAVIQTTSTGTNANSGLRLKTGDYNWILQTGDAVSGGIRFYDSSNSSERARIDSDGRLLVGTPSTSAQCSALIKDNSGSSGPGILRIHSSIDTPVNGATLGLVAFGANNDSPTSWIFGARDGGTWTAGSSQPTRLVFSTTANGASSPTERMRINSNGFTKFTNTGSYVQGGEYSYYEFLHNSNNLGLALTCTNASYTSDALYVQATRAASSAYDLATFWSSLGSDREFALRGDGNGYADGSWNGGGADYAEYFEWSDGNTTTEDRRGISVVLDGDKIREAVAGEEPIGVISGNPSVIGDAAWNKWSGKYLRDDFGTYIWEDYEVEDEDGNSVTQQRRKLNPDYDPDVEYVNRENRPEWDCVGLMGKLRIRKGQVTGARWIKMRDISDSVEEWLVR